MQGQTKGMSFLESFVNTTIGYVIAVSSQYIIFPIFNIYMPLNEHLIIGGFFTIISVIRSYFLRRFFNWFHYNYTMSALEKWNASK